jgi:hypothetical protein
MATGYEQPALFCRDGNVLSQAETARSGGSLSGVASPRPWSLAALGLLPGGDQFGN